MRPFRFAPVMILLPLAGCLPSRNNPFDPAVKPRPVLSVEVGGQASVTGSRHADWVLIGEESKDSDGRAVREFLWELSTGAADPSDLESVPGWTNVGSTPRVDTADASGAGLRDALKAVRDFSAEGYGASERTLRLTVEDGSGSRASLAARITLVNTRPTVSLGPDLRIAPGGRWWEIDPLEVTQDADGDDFTDVFDAAPRTVLLRATVSDPDAGDAATVLTAEYPARWEVHGHLAAVLDLDDDGTVDDAFFSDAGHGTLSIAAPVLPSASRFIIHTGDVRAPDGTLRESASDELRVDVGSSNWIVDHSTGFAQRIARQPVDRQPSFTTSPELLASAGGKILFLQPVASSPTVLHLADHMGHAVSRKTNFTFLATGVDTTGASGCTDGASGWWVLIPSLGELRHIDPDFGSQTYTDLDGGGADLAVTTSKIVAGASGRVWLLAAGSGEVRLFERSVAGEWSSRDVFPGPEVAYHLVSDGRNGVVVLGRSAVNAPTRMVRFAPDGTQLFDRTIDAEVDMGDGPRKIVLDPKAAYDPRSDSFWATGVPFGAQGQVFLHWAAGEPAVQVPFPYAVRQIFVDSADGGVLIAADLGMLRVGADGAVTAEHAMPQGRVLNDAIFTAGGSAFGTSGVGGALSYALTYFETGRVDEPRTLRLPLDVANQTSRHVAIDPATGFVWAYVPNEGGFRELAPTGEELRFVSLPEPAASSVQASVSASVELGSRRIWVAWSTSGAVSDGGLGWIDPGELVAAFHEVTGLDPFERVTDLDVLADGSAVCVAARRSTLPTEDVVLFRPDADATTGTTVSVEITTDAFASLYAAAQDRDGSCWFSGSLTSVARVAAGSTAPNLKGNLGRTARIPAPDYWDNLVWVPSYQYGDIDWLVLFTPGATGGDPYPPNPTDAAPTVAYPFSSMYDPFYRHLYIGIEGSFFGPGEVLRLDRVQRVVQNEFGVDFPVLVSSN